MNWVREMMATAKKFPGTHEPERWHRSSSRRPRPQDVTWKEGRVLAKYRKEANRGGLVHSYGTGQRKT